MTRVIRALVGVVIFAGLCLTAAKGQAAPAVPDGPRYAITYIEVMSTAAAEGATLARAMRDAMRSEAGNLRSGAVVRIGQANQFVILSAWKDDAALAAHAKAPQTVQLLERLTKIQNAPYDERVTFPLSVDQLHATLGADAVVVVSHVDVIPTQREMATALVKQHAEDGRQEPGNLRFEALTQTNRQNHFTVVEAWKDLAAAQIHGMNATTRAFRDKIAPAIGALYDERFYTPLK